MASAAIALSWAIDNHHTFSLVGWNYGDPKVPVPTGTDRIIVMDVRLSEVIDQEHWSKCTWIDHHKSSIDDFVKSGAKVHKCYLLDGVAACRLAWQFFMNDRPAYLPDKQAFIDSKVSEPWLIKMIGEYDVWDKRSEIPDHVKLWLESQLDVTFHKAVIQIKRFLSEDLRDRMSIVEAGHVIKEWFEKLVQKTADEKAYIVEFEGLRCMTLASCHALGSSWFGEHHPSADALLSWRFDGESVSVSLYHAKGKEHLDLSDIAKKYGGGGHRGACGFRLSLEDAVRMFGTPAT